MTDKSEHWREDARNFGAWHRGGSWAAGLLVARNVEPGTGSGVGANQSGKNLPLSNRVSLRDFATEAGVSHPTVAAYLRAWELAADDGLVNHAAELESDSDYDWDAETHTHERWVSYYRKQVKPKAEKPQPKPKPKFGGGTVSFSEEQERQLIYKVFDEGKTKQVAEAEVMGWDKHRKDASRPMHRLIAAEEAKRDQEAKSEAVAVNWDSLPGPMQKKLETMRRQVRRELQAEFEPLIQAGVKDRLRFVAKDIERMRSDIHCLRMGQKGIFSRSDYDTIRSCLHPDSRLSVSDDKLAKAFRLFNEAEIVLMNEKDHPTTTLPSLDELLMRLQKAN